MVSLKLLLMVDMHLSQAQGKTNNDTTILGNLTLIIVMGDFYQFSLMVSKLL